MASCRNRLAANYGIWWHRRAQKAKPNVSRAPLQQARLRHVVRIFYTARQPRVLVRLLAPYTRIAPMLEAQRIAAGKRWIGEAFEQIGRAHRSSDLAANYGIWWHRRAQKAKPNVSRAPLQQARLRHVVRIFYTARQPRVLVRLLAPYTRIAPMLEAQRIAAGKRWIGEAFE